MTQRLPRVAVAVGLVALVVLAGCAGAGGGADGTTGGDGAQASAGDRPTAAEEATTAGSGGDSPPGAALQGAALQERQRVRTGEATVRVEEFDRAVTNLTAATDRLGGFVADTGRDRHRHENESWHTGRLVLRVPAGNYSALQERVAAEGTVLHSASEVDDVTGDIVDLQARLDNLRAQRDRLRDLYDRANGTEDVLAVGQRLSGTQEEIERLEGRLASLQDRVAYSTLAVDLREPEPDGEATDAADRPDWAQTGVVAAFLDSTAGVVTTLRLLVVAVAYLLPYALVFGTPLVAVVAWRRRRSGSASSGEPAPESE